MRGQSDSVRFNEGYGTDLVQVGTQPDFVLKTIRHVGIGSLPGQRIDGDSLPEVDLHNRFGRAWLTNTVRAAVRVVRIDIAAACEREVASCAVAVSSHDSSIIGGDDVVVTTAEH